MGFFCSCSLRLLPYYISKWEHPGVYMLGRSAGACWNTALENSLQKDATQALGQLGTQEHRPRFILQWSIVTLFTCIC